jgi:hypothetical protein
MILCFFLHNSFISISKALKVSQLLARFLYQETGYYWDLFFNHCFVF